MEKIELKFDNGTKIMVVEDDKFLAQLLAKKLVGSGAFVLYAYNGEEALGMLEKEIPSLILLDILLPGIDGFEVLKRMKVDEKWKNIPVIVLSNFGSDDQIKTGQQLGVDNYLIKATVTTDEIIKEVKNSLDKRNNKQQN